MLTAKQASLRPLCRPVFQVADAFTEEHASSKAPACKHTGGLRLMSKGRELQPALGLAWANCINTRIFLSKTEFIVSTSCLQQAPSSHHLLQPVTLPLRCMQIVFSPCLPQDSCLYVVSQQGLQGVDPAQLAAGDVQRCQYDAEEMPVCQPEQCTMTRQHTVAPSMTEQGLQSSASAMHDDHAALQCRTNLYVDLRTSSSNDGAGKKHQSAIATGVFASD